MKHLARPLLGRRPLVARLVERRNQRDRAADRERERDDYAGSPARAEPSPDPGGELGEPGGEARSDQANRRRAKYWLTSAQGQAPIVGAERKLCLTMLEVRRLRLLSEPSRRGTIADVARAVGYTPSAVSQALAQLERETGVALLERDGRRVRLALPPPGWSPAPTASSPSSTPPPPSSPPSTGP